MKKQYIRASFKYTIAALLALVCALLFACSLTSGIAYAGDGIDENTFDILFPQNSYFQSANPTLIGANSSYLIVYDSASKKLYVRSHQDVGTWTYNIDFDNVSSIYALGDSAFIVADGEYYTVDLSNKLAKPTLRQLTSPSDISYLNSDGTYLYAKSTAGYITVYDQDLNIAFDCDNLYNDDLLAGKPVIAGENDNVYVFTIVYGNPFLVKYNLTSGVQENGIGLTKYVQSAYVGDIIYALETVATLDTTHIVGIDKNDGSVLFTSDICPDTFFAFGNRLFAIEGKQISIYTLADDSASLKKIATISMAGNDIFHLDNPSDVAKIGDNLVVADTNNSRLAIIDSSLSMISLPLEIAPLRLCSHDNTVYIASNDTLLKATNLHVETLCQLDNILDITFLDKIYILTTDGVYTLFGGQPLKLFDVESATRISCAKDGTNLYILKDDEIATININGASLPSIYVGDTTGVVDFAIDYEGKVSLVYQDRVSQYYNSTLEDTIAFEHASLNATATSAIIDNGKLFFTANECFLGVCNVDMTSKDTFVAPEANYDLSAYHFAVRKDETVVFFPATANVEGVMLSVPNVLLVLDTPCENNENLVYAVANGNIVLVNKNDLNTVDTNVLSGEYATTDNTTLYQLPYFSTQNVDVESGTRVSVISDCAGFENDKWLLVRYNEKVYFANAKVLAPYVETVPETDRVYGKAVGKRVGGLVNIYTAQDTSSPVLTQIVDGTKVEVLETHDEFYLVLYDGQTGYMLKSEVKIEGLTTVQIVAIVLSILVLLAGSAIFAAIQITRKKDDSLANI